MPDDTELTLASDREIVTTRTFAAPPDRVFDAFVNPDVVPLWWGTGETVTEVDVVDLQPGGTWRFIECRPDGTRTAVGGRYREVDRSRRLVFTFEREAMPQNTVVNTIEFVPVDRDASRVTITSRFASTAKRDEMFEQMQLGFHEEYRALDRVLAERAAS